MTRQEQACIALRAKQRRDDRYRELLAELRRRTGADVPTIEFQIITLCGGAWHAFTV